MVITWPCDVEIISRAARCGRTPAEPFTAQCQCGHEIGGHMCEKCAHCKLPGCLTCWQDSKGHLCHVYFAAAKEGM
jgi:hypothetical protein